MTRKYLSSYEEGVEDGRNECADQLAEQQTNHMALVAQLERERDDVELIGRAAICDLQKKLAAMTNERDILKKELAAISKALDDPRTDLSMTMVEIIQEMKTQLATMTKERSPYHYPLMRLTTPLLRN